MTVLTTSKPITDCSSDPMLPNWAEIVKIEQEAPGVKTYWLKFTDPKIQKEFSFKPGQFNLLTVPGYVRPQEYRGHWSHYPFDRQCY